MAIWILLQGIAAHMELSVEELVEYYRTVKRDSEALNHCLQLPEMLEHNARVLVLQSASRCPWYAMD
jgi:hypothetical protein